MTFQEQLNLMRAGGVPLPLMPGQATAQAVRLRAKGLPYSSIAVVMAMYHGHGGGTSKWQSQCRKAGAPGKPHGRPFQSRSQEVES